jgi:hypothetical protein
MRHPGTPHGQRGSPPNAVTAAPGGAALPPTNLAVAEGGSAMWPGAAGAGGPAVLRRGRVEVNHLPSRWIGYVRRPDPSSVQVNRFAATSVHVKGFVAQKWIKIVRQGVTGCHCRHGGVRGCALRPGHDPGLLLDAAALAVRRLDPCRMTSPAGLAGTGPGSGPGWAGTTALGPQARHRSWRHQPQRLPANRPLARRPWVLRRARRCHCLLRIDPS